MRAAAAVLCAAGGAAGFYIPGVSPVSYARGQPVRIMANSMTSPSGILPYGPYAIKSCSPSPERMKRESKRENLGELLFGDEIVPSLYEAAMQINTTCRRLCDEIEYAPDQMKLIEKRIEQMYRSNLVLDNLPIAVENRVSTRHPPVAVGYPMGVPKRWSKDRKTTLINNHLHITINYHKPDLVAGAAATAGVEAWRIVGFLATPHSVAHTEGSCVDGKVLDTAEMQPLTTAATKVTWSYSVSWKEDMDTAWATRWDVILRSAPADAKIHWFSIVNSCLILLFLTGMVAMILLRSLHKDFNRYNDPDNEEAAQEETGWKLVHGDVFRPPQAASLLSVLVGTGCQLLGMLLITLVFALLGFLSPANRGGLATAMLLLFVLLGGYGGYVSARLCKTFGNQSWMNIFLTGTLFPGACFIIYILLDIVQWVHGASNAIPFTSVLNLFGLWLGISLPLVVVGGSVGFKRDAMSAPCAVHAQERPVPEQRWYLRTPFVVPLAGILPFGAVFIELVFILSSLWQGRVYYVFGFLALVFLISVFTCAEIAIVIVYFQLCYEDHAWWWRAFMAPGSSALHLFLYAIFYYVHTLNISSGAAALIYFGYMLMIALFFGVVAGTIGFLSSYAFVRKIYSSIKVD